uniref:Uncharacterized protein n=1 Tax=Anguilla anguilla TaxID=7936 RepID=A0A0E9U688_ANGAN
MLVTVYFCLVLQVLYKLQAWTALSNNMASNHGD